MAVQEGDFGMVEVIKGHTRGKSDTTMMWMIMIEQSSILVGLLRVNGIQFRIPS